MIVTAAVLKSEAFEKVAFIQFDSILKMVVVAHSLFYFTQRRPHLIKVDAAPAGELLRWGNLATPAIFAVGGLGFAFAVKELAPTYGWVPVTMLLGMALFYFFQAISLAMVERDRRDLPGSLRSNDRETPETIAVRST